MTKRQWRRARGRIFEIIPGFTAKRKAAFRKLKFKSSVMGSVAEAFLYPKPVTPEYQAFLDHVAEGG